MEASEDFRTTAFKFVQQLAADLGGKELELPGFPDVVMRIHMTLADENSAVQDVVNLISSEPALSARLVQLANSAAFNANGIEITDPRAAIQRLGFNVVRSTATSFAMTQMKNQDWLNPVRPQLGQIWRRSNAVAATGHAMGDAIDGIRSDEALAAGLFHQLGNLYLLTHAHKSGIDVAGNPEWNEIASGWHPTIARAILENWGMSEKIAEAVENQDVLFLEDDVDATSLSLLTRLLSAAKLHDIVTHEQDEAQPGWNEKLAGIRLSGESFTDLQARAQNDIDAVSQSIG